MLKYSYKNSTSWFLYNNTYKHVFDFLTTLGNIGKDTINTIKSIIKFKIDFKEFIYQCSRFGVDSLPITITIVGMVSIIIAMQIAPELTKQGGGDYIGMFTGIVMTRELGVIMSGFAIISMIGSSMSSEIASMRVTEQIDAMKVLKVNPIEYIFVPRILAGTIMMPFVVTVASFIGIICACLISHWTADITILNFIQSLWHGLTVKDINVSFLKSMIFGFTITMISCSCGYATRGGAKEVGTSTTKAVVWSFVGIAIWDYVVATIFYT